MLRAKTSSVVLQDVLKISFLLVLAVSHSVVAVERLHLPSTRAHRKR